MKRSTVFASLILLTTILLVYQLNPLDVEFFGLFKRYIRKVKTQQSSFYFSHKSANESSDSYQIDFQDHSIEEIESMLLTMNIQFGGEHFVMQQQQQQQQQNQQAGEEFESSNKSNQYSSSRRRSSAPNLYHLAFIIPFRNRLDNLKIFLCNLHPYLIRHQVSYGIYLVEPVESATFNRGLLMNVGFVEALRESNNKWNCFVFHDVDMIPENDLVNYTCNKAYPLHFAVAVSKFNYE